MRVLLALLILSIPGLAQPLTIGVKGGLRATSEPQWYGTPESRPYLAGPAVEIRLPHQFAFEVDALYSRLGNTLFVPLIMTEFFARTRANVWTELIPNSSQASIDVVAGLNRVLWHKQKKDAAAVPCSGPCGYSGLRPSRKQRDPSHH